MKITYNELKKLGITTELKKLEPMFFQLGHEVEEVIDKNINHLVIGKIAGIAPHPDSEKLQVCQVDIGTEMLQIVCGATNARLNLKVVVAVVGAKIGELTIEPIVLRGVDSSGMLCSLAELGYNKDNLNSVDYEGILELDSNAVIGENPLRFLELDDQILDIFLTANRGDCQSYRGLYNDLKALLNYNQQSNKHLSFDNLEANILKEEEFKDCSEQVTFQTNFEQTPFFSTQIIKNIKIQESEISKRNFLLKHGIKSQNNMTDISNEILLRWGIPSHIYDADLIKGNLVVKLTETSEEFIGLDEKEITIPVGTLVICDTEKIVAIAGVMGSNATKVTEQTTNILLEVAEFNPQNVFAASKVIGKKTESALRYEKKIDREVLSKVQKILVQQLVNHQLEEQISKIEVGPLVTTASEVEIDLPIGLNLENVTKILGIEIPTEEIIKILKALDFKVSEINQQRLEIKYPSYRNDLEIENDLIEEIIRVYNVDNISDAKSMSTFIPFEPIINNTTINFSKKIEQNLLRQHLNQTITYSLVSEDQVQKFGNDTQKAIKIMSPLSKDHHYYRQSLVPSLIEISKNNFAYQQKQTTFFELGNTYQNNGQELIEEIKVAGLVSGEKATNFLGNKTKYDFYDIKNIILNLMDDLGLDVEIKKFMTTPKELNPYSSGLIVVEGIEIGIIGEIVFDYYKKMKNKLYIFEFSIQKLEEISKNKQFKYQVVSNLPQIIRDLTFELDEQVTYEQVKAVFAGAKYIKEIKVMDIYQGEYLTAGKKKLTLKINFFDQEQTLTNEIVDVEIQKIFELSDQLGYIINR